MSIVIRLSDDNIKVLEEYRNNMIEINKHFSDFSSREKELEKYKNMSINDLLSDALMDAKVRTDLELRDLNSHII